MRALHLILYRINSRVKNRIKKEYTHDFEFIRLLKRLNIPFLLKRKSIEISGKENDIKFKLSLKRFSSDGLVFKQIFIEKEYHFIVDLIQSKNIQMTTMYDFGANIGLTSMFFKFHFPNCKIEAFEINQNTLKRAVSNFNANQLDIQIHHKGVWSKNDQLFLDNSFRDQQDWSNSLSKNNTEGESIQCFSISELINKTDTSFVKIDIEGGEFELFKTKEYVEEWLPFVQIIAIEIHAEVSDANIIYNHLQRLNFHLFTSGELLIGVNKKLIQL